MAAFLNNGLREALQGFFVGYVPDKPAARLFVDDPDGGAFPDKGVRDGFADALAPPVMTAVFPSNAFIRCLRQQVFYLPRKGQAVRLHVAG